MVNYGREVDDFYKQSTCKQQPYQKPSCCMIGVLLEAWTDEWCGQVWWAIDNVDEACFLDVTKGFHDQREQGTSCYLFSTPIKHKSY